MAKGFSTTPDPESKIGALRPKNRQKLRGPGDSNKVSKNKPSFSQGNSSGRMGRKGC